MIFKLIDAYGVHVGDAKVEWATDGLEEEARDIFTPFTQAILTTRHPGLAWRAEITFEEVTGG